MTSRSDPRGYYAALGVPLTATAEDIRRAFGERAKRLHPDQTGGQGDPASFQRVVEAYEVLRDPSRRLRYDADSVDMHRGEPLDYAEYVEAAEPDPLARPWSPRRFWPSGRLPLADLALPGLPVLATLAALLVLVLAGFAWALSQRASLAEREERISELTLQVERARAEQAESDARYRAASIVDLETALAAPATEGEPAHVFAADLRFEPGSAELGAALDQQMVQAVEELSAVVAQIPADRNWLVLIQGQAARAAGVAGVEVASWQLSLLRISQIIDRLVQAGLPADHVAMRFSAGFAPEAAGADPARTVELRVVCCLR
ncbi:DnaJ domain-containing protein [Geminicoccus roseus]|uniref:DnaJ domain-containing protein n=1 Tax=Geminicoccus roseus TaxID=404900 RepID=UPI0004865B11|nr:DnaJ domain-containing protein [Geminicoccus roseus]